MSHIRESYNIFFFCDWLISLEIMSSSVIHVSAYVRILFLINQCLFFFFLLDLSGGNYCSLGVLGNEYWFEYTIVSCPLSRVQVFVTPWTVAYQAPLSMDSPGKSTGVGSHFPSPGDLPTQGSTLGLLHSRKTL